VFDTEKDQQPRVITFGLHPHIIGVAHLAHQLSVALDLLKARDDTAFLTSSQIGDWFVSVDGTNGAAVMDRPPQ
jgi:allantoinase